MEEKQKFPSRFSIIFLFLFFASLFFSLLILWVFVCDFFDGVYFIIFIMYSKWSVARFPLGFFRLIKHSYFLFLWFGVKWKRLCRQSVLWIKIRFANLLLDWMTGLVWKWLSGFSWFQCTVMCTFKVPTFFQYERGSPVCGALKFYTQSIRTSIRFIWMFFFQKISWLT